MSLSNCDLRIRDEMIRFFTAVKCSAGYPLAGPDQLTKAGFVFDDPDIAVDTRKPWEAVGERCDVSDAIAGLKLVVFLQLIDESQILNTFAPVVQFAHALEDAAMLLNVESSRRQGPGHLWQQRPFFVEQDRTQNELFRLDVGGHALLQRG